MNLTLRTRIFIIISLAVLIILAISIVLVVITKKAKPTQTSTDEPTKETTEQTQIIYETIDSVNKPTTIQEGMIVKPATPEETVKFTALNLAKTFVERYGSYSTDNVGENLRDLESLSTSDLWKILENRINNLKVSKEFAGVITKSIGADFVSYTTDKAVVKVLTMREENKNNEVRKYNQEAEVVLVKNNGGWLIDDVKWK